MLQQRENDTKMARHTVLAKVDPSFGMPTTCLGALDDLRDGESSPERFQASQRADFPSSGFCRVCRPGACQTTSVSQWLTLGRW